MRNLCMVLFAASAVFLSGGHGAAGDEELGTVEGTVTYKGRPLTDATITFHLKDDQFVGAKVKEGKYRVDRVPAGKVVVTIDAKKLRLPGKYALEQTSPLRVKIEKGKTTVDFDLTL
jgi:hypothetical protein